ncbi:hypothetical protein BGX34_001954 [Mortierella sp. NVP85]|nr:hypothetical protein BGX34_001954 [Mortierella sp. NVP85]
MKLFRNATVSKVVLWVAIGVALVSSSVAAVEAEEEVSAGIATTSDQHIAPQSVQDYVAVAESQEIPSGPVINLGPLIQTPQHP